MKVRVTSGPSSQLTVLRPSELGHTTDDNRLFLGQNLYTVTSNAGTPARTTFTIPMNAVASPVYQVYVNDVPVSSAGYSIIGTTLNINTVPNNATVKLGYNSELKMASEYQAPMVTQLTGSNGSTNNTGIQFPIDDYDAVFLKYTLSTTLGSRIGNLRILVDQQLNTAIIDDVFNTSVGMPNGDFAFIGTVENDIMLLQYQTNDSIIYNFKYLIDVWKA